MLIATVLRSGGEYTPDHVRWLHQQLPASHEAVCFSDVPIPGINVIKLRENWPGWWAKIELFRPDIKEDLFFLDLDTVITGDISGILAHERFTMLRDFFHLTQLASAVMRIPHDVKAQFWNAFTAAPAFHMSKCVTPKFWGDQGFIAGTRGSLPVDTWQHVFPGQICSYKANVVHRSRSPFAQPKYSWGNGQLPGDARIVCFHGDPRPWDKRLREPWIPALEAAPA